MEKSFLNKKYPDLHKSPEVESAVNRAEKRGETNPKDTNERIEVYLRRFDEILYATDPKKRERRTTILKNKLHDLFVMERDDIPESYFELQRRIAKEQGHGDIELNDRTKDWLAEIAVKDQEKSLDSWFDYLASSDSKYPAWFKYYAIRSIAKLGNYNKEKRNFQKRSSTTTAPFPELNREALAIVFDQVSEANIADANFSELYGSALEKATQSIRLERSESIEGEWRQFSDEAQVDNLVRSIKEYGTGWCIAGEATAKGYLEYGDIYVYYTKDGKGQYTVPRIAIRLENDKVAEVRGVGVEQELESVLLDTAREKWEDLPGGESYEKRFSDMKQLTSIDRKVSKGEELNSEELRFLYEVDGKIEGFGYEKDPRIQEIISKRDRRRDYATMFNCEPGEVSMETDEVDDDSIVCVGDIEFSGERMPKKLKYVFGNVSFSNYEIRSLGNLVAINGDADFNRSRIEKLGKLRVIDGDAVFRGSWVKELNSLEWIGGDADFAESDVQQLGSLSYIGGTITIDENTHIEFGNLDWVDESKINYEETYHEDEYHEE